MLGQSNHLVVIHYTIKSCKTDLKEPIFGVVVDFTVVCSNHSFLVKLYIINIVGLARKEVVDFDITVP